MKTKHIIIFSIFTVVLTGCSQSDEQLIAEAEAKIAEHRVMIESCESEISELQKTIAELKHGEEDELDLLQVTSFNIPKGDFNHYFTVKGNIETDKNALIFPETQGVVKSISVREGQRVSKGQKLMSLDMDLIYKNIQEVETSYELAKEIYERQERLWEQKIGSEVQYLEAKSRKESLDATLSTLRTQAGKGVVKAPFAGVIDEISPKIGEMASPAMPVARVVSLNEMYVTSQVSENYSGAVKEGMNVRVIVPGVDTLLSKVDRVGQYINPENRTFEVMVALDEETALKPNMYAALEINDIQMDSVALIPSSMIQQDSKGAEFVYKLNKNDKVHVVKKTVIQTGPSYDAQTVVMSGIRAGDIIVDEGSRKVIHDQEVEVIN